MSWQLQGKKTTGKAIVMWKSQVVENKRNKSDKVEGKD